MKKKSVFGKGMTFLVTGLLAILAFFRGPLEFRLLCGLFAIWAIWMITALLLSPLFKRLGASIIAHWRRAKAARLRRRAQRKITLVPDPYEPNITQTLLMHVNCRISAYIKSAFPDATWTWCNDDADDVVLNGGVGRIKLFCAEDYNYADIRIDRMARIECSLLKLIPLNGVAHDGHASAQALPFEPGIWYGVHGKAVIESCLAEIHSRGHGGLLVKENGDVCVSLAGNEEKHATLCHMPERSYWPSLLKIFEINGITANATDKGIALSL